MHKEENILKVNQSSPPWKSLGFLSMVGGQCRVDASNFCLQGDYDLQKKP